MRYLPAARHRNAIRKECTEAKNVDTFRSSRSLADAIRKECAEAKLQCPCMRRENK